MFPKHYAKTVYTTDKQHQNNSNKTRNQGLAPILAFATFDFEFLEDEPDFPIPFPIWQLSVLSLDFSSLTASFSAFLSLQLDEQSS